MTCQDFPQEPAVGDAMLQVNAEPHKYNDGVRRLEAHSALEMADHDGADERNATASKPHCQATLMDTHIEDAQHCLPSGLIEQHVSSIRYQATLLTQARKQKMLMEKDKKTKVIDKSVETATVEVDGSDASLDAAGFKSVTSLCCPPEMETFFHRLLADKGLEACSKDHVQGLMHWFSCVPDMDYQYLLDTIDKGNPCKYWETLGTTCPPLSPECQGEYCR